MPKNANNANNANNARNANNQLCQSVYCKMTYRSFRKISEKFERRKEEVLMKKECKEGGVSL